MKQKYQIIYFIIMPVMVATAAYSKTLLITYWVIATIIAIAYAITN